MTIASTREIDLWMWCRSNWLAVFSLVVVIMCTCLLVWCSRSPFWSSMHSKARTTILPHCNCTNCILPMPSRMFSWWCPLLAAAPISHTPLVKWFWQAAIIPTSALQLRPKIDACYPLYGLLIPRMEAGFKTIFSILHSVPLRLLEDNHVRFCSCKI